jgi:DNA-binding MarR family transcriptional regulator
MKKATNIAGQVSAPAEMSACNCLALRQATRHVTQLYERHMASAGLRSSQFSILSKLSRLGALSINQLAAMMVMDRTTMGRAVRPLERDGLIAMSAGREDARTRMVRLTPAGAKKYEQAAALWRNAQEEFERSFGSGNARALRETMARIVSAVPDGAAEA